MRKPGSTLSFAGLGVISRCFVVIDGGPGPLLRVYIKSLPANTTVDQVEAKILHNTPGGVLRSIFLTRNPGNPILYEGTFTPPSGWMGWGNYSVNVKAQAKDSANNLYVSDWWPRLRVH